ncbi:hypothetical protein SEA_SPILLED_257 [Streptomyces phage Spilled]|uniref:hypothetical protein n=1 Tax=Streptomyces sp. JV178 TaxID=858632 RepID=UPI00117D6728|nr:hypothetical protein [Streptomyces sp. JV178]QFP97521.1 hypothetical protein SEA_ICHABODCRANE_244 [Streptomyces phage IchabodCrane]QPL13841.1 hypothetical protein SEA_MINDFLAYER_243 [Streptomyces phage MindFlayer]URM87734.1 hypothetical protein SEA_QUARAN19_250 [Streptomyces phage Quaran19]UVK60104.1 hypothetical protein SEA_SPILLED_257 [Streptomyces phage Spilled]UVK61059.1 hypothetical protein SEA_JIMJAM_257 [Streptomyces phage JimJam]
MVTELSQELKKLFDEKQYRWRVNGRLKKPTLRDLEDALEKIKDKLKNEPVGTWVYVGRLIVVKDAEGKLDVYVHHGTIEEEDAGSDQQTP